VIDAPAETAYINAVLADKPMGYWPLNEPAGAKKFFDRSGNSIHGFAVNNVVAGQPGPLPDNSRAIELNGDGYIYLGHHPEFAMKNDFTVEAWMWIGAVKRRGMVFAAHGLDENPAGWSLNAGHANPESPAVLQFSVWKVKDDIDLLLAGRQAIEGSWLHIAVVYDRSNTAHFYLNGERRNSVAVGAPVVVEPVWLTIGCGEASATPEQIDTTRWRGRIAHVAVYPHALVAQQVQNHYKQRGPVPADVSLANRKETP
jgi:hypothetical protein